MEFPAAGDIFQQKYRIVDVIGEGGFGTVYLAMDTGLQRSVAIKLLKPGYRGYDEQTKARFMREANVIANLKDPHTVTLFDFGSTESGLLYMVFEHVPGRDLSELLHEAGRLPEQAAVHILRQLLLSLGEAHRAGQGVPGWALTPGRRAASAQTTRFRTARRSGISSHPPLLRPFRKRNRTTRPTSRTHSDGGQISYTRPTPASTL